MELCLGMDNESAGTLWVRISVQTNMGSTVVGIHYRVPSQEEVQSSWETLTIPVTAERAAQHSTTNPGGLWSTLI